MEYFDEYTTRRGLYQKKILESFFKDTHNKVLTDIFYTYLIKSKICSIVNNERDIKTIAEMFFYEIIYEFNGYDNRSIKQDWKVMEFIDKVHYRFKCEYSIVEHINSYNATIDRHVGINVSDDNITDFILIYMSYLIEKDNRKIPENIVTNILDYIRHDKAKNTYMYPHLILAHRLY